jgi:tetratricopeptide (TPR) repeat protein
MTLPSIRRFLLYLTAFLVAAFLVFGPSLTGPFVFDDAYQFFAAPQLPPGPPSSYLFGARPVVQVSYYLNHLAAADNPSAYRVVDIALHAFNASLVWLAVLLLLRTAGNASKAGDLAALAAAGLFLLHPLQTEGVCYISARSDVLCSTFFLLALNLFLYYRPTHFGWLPALSITALFLLAIGSKEIAIALPPLLVVYEFVFRRRVASIRESGAWRLYAVLGAGAIAGVALVLRYIVGAGTGVALKPDLAYFYTQWRALFTYVQLLIWPSPLNIDRDFPFSQTPLDYGAIYYLAALLTLLAILIWRRDRDGFVLFGLAFALLVLGPTSSLIPIQDPINERRMYLPMAGVAVLLVPLILRFQPPDRNIVAALCAIGGVYALLSYQRAEVWSSAISLWSETAAQSPNKFRPRFWLGQAYLAAGQCADAQREFDRALELIPKPDPELHFFRASAYACNNQHSAAVEEMSKSIALKGPDPQSLAFRATYYAATGELAKAHADLDDALRRNPDSVPALSTRGRIYLAEGRFAESVVDLERAVRLFPRDAALIFALDEARRKLQASKQ